MADLAKRQQPGGSRQNSEDRDQMLESRVKLISDLPLLTSVMDGFYDLNALNDLVDCLIDAMRYALSALRKDIIRESSLICGQQYDYKGQF
jgi:hypothetical protein